MFIIHPLTLNDLEAADQVLMSAYQVSSRKDELERLIPLQGTTWLAGQEATGWLGWWAQSITDLSLMSD